MNYQTLPLLYSNGMLSPPCTWGIPDILPHTIFEMYKGYYFARVPDHQVEINCGAIDEASRSLKAIDNRVIIDFLGKNAVIALFCDKNYVFELYDKNTVFALKLVFQETKTKPFNINMI